MNHSNSFKTSFFILAVATCFMLPANESWANVCQEGLGLPPFLSSGADPNLLLVLDNSGSMLDIAYSDTTSFPDDQQRCFDDTYSIDHPYAGYFEEDQWYQWTESSYAPWRTGVAYNIGDRVYVYGIIWEAQSNGTSNGARVDKDEGVDWEHVFTIKKWANDTDYAAGSFIWSGQQLYSTNLGGHSNDSDNSDGLSLADDTGVVWVEVASTWQNNTSYTADDIVTYKGIYYQAASTDTSNGTGVYDDNGVSWNRLNEGSFVAAGETSALAYCTAATGTNRAHDDLCLSFNDGVTPKQVTAFAARGNFLNWAMASKFDIEKKILTGGKYNYYDALMVSENRGCSGSRFIKQIELNDGYHLTMGVRGSKYDDDPNMEDRIDSTDDVGRLEILAITQNGFQGSQECQDALEYIAEHGLNGSQSTITSCTDTFPDGTGELADQNPVLNHSLQFCWQLENHQRNLGNIISECEHLYTGWHISQSYLPTELVPAYGAYICYGTYDSGLDHVNRNGYVGRCWDPGGSILGVDCNPVSSTDENCDFEGCEYGDEPNLYKNERNYNYKCTSFLSSACKTHNSDVPGNRKYWKLQYAWSDGSGSCAAGELAVDASPAEWDDTWDSHPATDDPENCILQASIDYCNDTKVPEVIDPSDEAGDTTGYWNIPGLLTDSEVIAQLGATHPLAVMKGYIQLPDRPEGILHEVADDIRLGAMAFNNVGAATECEPGNLTSGIERYCPKINKDGANLITSINKGSDVTDSNDTSYVSGERRHVDDLAESINDIQATSWTPLAEAMMSALGYFTQNSNLCLNKDASGDCLDYPISNSDSPIEYWCQDNHIIVITEGESTADINPNVSNFLVTPANFFGNTPSAEDNIAGDVDGDSSDTCSNLSGSTYFDDITWWGQNLGPLYIDRQVDGEDKQNVITQIVATSSLASVDSNNTTECDPKTLMENAATNGGKSLLTGEDPAQLEANLRAALSDILFRASAGSAASVISSSRSGEGGVYQAVFWPKVDRGIGTDPLQWVGDVHAFFIDEHGQLWDDYSANSSDTFGELWTEDINGNGLLDAGEDVYPLDGNGDPAPNGSLDGDRRIVTFYNNSTNSTQICLNPTVIDTGVCAASEYFNTPATALELRDFEDYLWSANQQLENISDISTNRELLADGTWDFANNRRYIFTWNDLDNDGIVDSDYDGNDTIDDDGDGLADREEILAFVPGINSPALTVTPAISPRNDLLNDFNVSTSSELDDLIEWLRGDDIYESAIDGTFTPYDLAEDKNNNGIQDYNYRCRKFPSCDPLEVNSPPWRLGDIIHSTPTLAARPAEGYHYVYNDPHYARFYKKYLERRHVIYFGSNDGMLHAVNGGFYQAGLNKFLPCRADQRDSLTNSCSAGSPNDIDSTKAYPALGDELWAYIPYNLQPHLSCLTNPSYDSGDHKYFVDGPPRIFDVRIFPDDDIHPGGWGTILVGYMRFGGAPTPADDTALITDNREFVSSYFILDITDPERPPTLIAEMSMTDETHDYELDGTAEEKYTRMGYTTSMPTVVAMRNDLGNSEWFLVIGNGPTTIKGQNDQQGKIAIIPLNSLTGVNWTVNGSGAYDSTARKPFRIPNEPPTSSSAIANFGRKLIETDSSGNLESFVGDMVTVDFDIKAAGIGGIGAPYKSDAVYFGTVDGSGFIGTDWGGDGRLFRMETNDLVDGVQSYTYPEDWDIKKLLDARGPITAAPNVGYDSSNFWVFFGTGRFYAPEDKTDSSTQYFFGVKEPLDTNCDFTWDEIEWWPFASASPIATDPSASPGQQGLLRTDPARVIESRTSALFNPVGEYLYCEDEAGMPCTLPLTPLNAADGDALRTYYAFSELERYIQGEKCGATNNNAIGIDGWYRHFNDPRERSLGMPTLLGGLTTYTSYQPFEDICKTEGVSYLYGVYFLTGTAWYENVFGTYNNAEDKSIVKDRLDLGKGQATTPSLQVGSGPNDANAYIQTSTGEIIQVGQSNLPFNNFKSGRTSWKNK